MKSQELLSKLRIEFEKCEKMRSGECSSEDFECKIQEDISEVRCKVEVLKEILEELIKMLSEYIAFQ